MVFLNGAILGIHRRPRRLVAAFRALRRAGRVGEFVSITLGADAVHVASDGGRVCRPLIICAAGVPSVTAAHIAKVRRATALPCSFPVRPTFWTDIGCK
jgi:DNA-directed RNA polymerase III subunit RPC2